MNPDCLEVARILARLGYQPPQIGEPNETAVGKIALALADLERRLLPPDLNEHYRDRSTT